MPSSASEARPIFLVGMMGAGKSTVGERLATRLGRRFIDLDRAVEAEAGESIEAMFTSGREGVFRELEHRLLCALDASGAVVAPGGGVVLRPANLDHMLGAGRVIYLRASVSTLLARLGASDEALAARPLLAGSRDRAATLAALLEARGAAYARAHVTIETDGRSLEEILDEAQAAGG